MSEYKLPDVGEGLTEAEIVTWRVKVGDEIKINDVGVEIETAKSLVELPSPYAGTVSAILVEEGETVPVGTPIIAGSDPSTAGGASGPAAPGPRIGGVGAPPPGGGGPAPAARPPPAPPAAEPPPPQAMDLSNPAASGGGENQTLVGYGPRAGAALRRARRGPATPATTAGSAAQMQVQGSFALGRTDPAEVEPGDEEPVPAVAARGSRTASDGDDRTVAARPSGAWSVGGVLAQPPGRQLARDLAADRAAVTPSGRGGIVTAADVEAAAGSPTAAEAPTVQVRSSGTPGLTDRREPVKGVRKMMAQAMVDSAFSA